MCLSDQAKSRAQLSRTANDRQVFDYWRNQLYQLQQGIAQYRQRLAYLQPDEQNLRYAVNSYGPNAISPRSLNGEATVQPLAAVG